MDNHREGYAVREIKAIACCIAAAGILTNKYIEASLCFGGANYHRRATDIPTQATSPWHVKCFPGAAASHSADLNFA
ncbi:MAG TPA: hypothetical protein VGC86_14680 [Afipia sp.]